MDQDALEQRTARTAAAPPVGSADLASPAFRERAIAAYRAGAHKSPALLVAGPGLRALLSAIAVLVVGALVLAALCEVEVTGSGRGVLRGNQQPQFVSSEISGRVSDVFVRSGEVVEVGQRLLAIDARELRAALVEARARLDRAERRLQEVSTRDKDRTDKILRLLGRKQHIAVQRAEISGRTTAAWQEREHSYRALAEAGWAARAESVEHGEHIDRLRHEQLGARSEVAEIGVNAMAIRGDFEQALHRAVVELEEAESEEASLFVRIEQTQLVATQSGRIEAISAARGELVEAGRPLARLVPLEAPIKMSAFLPERDRAFLVRGTEVKIEIDQLPVAEFGRITGLVERIDDGLATQEEVRAELGEAIDGPLPSYRVEVALYPQPEQQRALSLTRAGMFATAHFELRRRKVAALLFSPLRRWLE